MNRLKRSWVAKIVSGLVFCVALVAFIVSSVFECVAIGEYHGSGRYAAEQMKEDAYQNIINDKLAQVYTLFSLYLKGRTDEYEYKQIKQSLSEEESNYSFVIKTAEGSSYKMEPFSNYECTDYSYKSVHEPWEVEVANDTKTFIYNVDKLKSEDLTRSNDDYWSDYRERPNLRTEYYYDNYGKNPRDYLADYDGDEYDAEINYIEEDMLSFSADMTYDVKNDDYIAANGMHVFPSIKQKGEYTSIYSRDQLYEADDISWNYLDRSSDFCTKYNNFFKAIDEAYDNWTYNENYIPSTGNYIVTVNCSDSETFEVTSYVRSKLTAHDEFYDAPVLRYIDFLSEYAMLILIISTLLVAVSGGFLIASAGHTRDSDEITESLVDKIPFDIFLVAWLIISAGFINEMQYSNYTLSLFVLGMADLFVPITLYTLAARIKLKSLFKNTICYRLWCSIIYDKEKKGGFLYKLYSAIKSFKDEMARLLEGKISIYSKYIGTYCLLALLKMFILLMCSGGISPDVFFVLFVVLLLETIVVALLIAIICVNLNRLKKAGEEIAAGNLDYDVNTEGMFGEFKAHGEKLNNIKLGISNAVAESIKSERMKSELITNVSHDIKTPLTSIINYVDLLKKEEIDNETANGYIEVLDRQSARLKKLIQDLIDASKASTGNMDVNLEKTDINVMINQVLGEFEEKLSGVDIKAIVKSEAEVYALADGRLLWRVFENLITNIIKYGQPHSRAYIDVATGDTYVSITVKNISKDELNISGEELMERFVRGDSSRNTDGSGLGLSIAKSLMELQNGKMEIIVDGDLFKGVLLLVMG